MFHVPAHKNTLYPAAQIGNVDTRPFFAFDIDGNIVYHEPTKAEVLNFAIAEDRATRLATARQAAFGEAA